MKKSLFFALIVGLCISSLVIISGCGSGAAGGGGSGVSGVVYYGMGSDGSTAKITVTGSTYKYLEVAGPDPGFSFSGKLSTNESGLISVEITACPDEPGLTFETFYALEVSNEVLVVAGGAPGIDPFIIFAPALTSIAPSKGSYEVVSVPWSGWDTEPAPFGRIGYVTMEVTDSPMVGQYYWFNDYLYDQWRNCLGVTTDDAYYFTGNRLYNNEPYKAQIFANPNGLIAGANITSESGGFIGAKYDGTVLETDIYDGRTFTGVGYSTLLDGTDPGITPLHMVPDTAAKMTVFKIEEVSGAKVSIMGTMDIGTRLPNGVIPLDLNSGTNIVKANMVASKVDGKYILCGSSTIEPDGGPLTFILVQD